MKNISQARLLDKNFLCFLLEELCICDDIVWLFETTTLTNNSEWTYKFYQKLNDLEKRRHEEAHQHKKAFFASEVLFLALLSFSETNFMKLMLSVTAFDIYCRKCEERTVWATTELKGTQWRSKNITFILYIPIFLFFYFRRNNKLNSWPSLFAVFS